MGEQVLTINFEFPFKIIIVDFKEFKAHVARGENKGSVGSEDTVREDLVREYPEVCFNYLQLLFIPVDNNQIAVSPFPEERKKRRSEKLQTTCLFTLSPAKAERIQSF